MIKQYSKDDINTHPKLLAMFKALRQQHIMTGRDYWCCNTCASYDMAAKGKSLVAKGRKVIGGVFYHHQARESAQECGRLYLNFGTIEGSDVDTKAIGERVVEAAHVAGLKVEWDGDPARKIVLDLFAIVDEDDIPQSVINALVTVRDSGAVNMFDRDGVIHVCQQVGKLVAARWLRDHKANYVDALEALSRQSS
jgi:hypothetical protein